MLSLGIIARFLVILLVLAAGLLGTATGAHAAQSSEQIEEKRALGFVAAMSRGDAEALLVYTEANFSLATWQSRSLPYRHGSFSTNGVDVCARSDDGGPERKRQWCKSGWPERSPAPAG